MIQSAGATLIAIAQAWGSAGKTAGCGFAGQHRTNAAGPLSRKRQKTKTAESLALHDPRWRAISLLLTCAMVISGAMWGQTVAFAQSEAEPRLDASVTAGLAFLAQQQTADGAFEGGGPRTAMTGLVLMSFLASGHVPDAGKYGLTVRRAVDYLVEAAPEDGYFGRVDGSRMYGHGIVTLALSEACGVEPDPDRRAKIRAILAKSVKVILAAQAIAKPPEQAGGWRYEPQSGDSDLSLSGWNALALRAAQGEGMDVPKEHIAQAVAFVLKCYRPDVKAFAYQPNGEPSIAMTGVGVLNLYLLDAADRPEVSAAAFLVSNPVKDDTRMPYYAMYYATQAAFQAGEPVWPAVWKVTQERLLGSQMKDGGWPQSRNGEEPGRVYATSMAVLTMSVPYRLLPIYQR